MLDLLTIRRELHQHPETGFNELWTAAYLADTLKKLGLTVYQKFAQTGVVAVLPGTEPSQPALAYRADIDALPVREATGLPFAATNGCMHACGHDLHMTIALGLAEKLRQTTRARTIVFVFQPNEEGAPGEMPAGAEAMCDAGLLTQFNISQMLALHVDPTLPTGKLGVCDGTLWAASGRFKVNVTGKGCHAAYPERGCDALLAAAKLVERIYVDKARQRKIENEVLSICKLNSGDAFNVIASKASFEGIVRAPTRDHLNGMFDIIRRACAATDLEFGTQTSVETYYGALPVINDAHLTALARKTWSDRATEIKMTMASEDFSHFSTRIPSFYAMLGVNATSAPMPPLHAENFAPDENAIAFGVQAMAQLVEALVNT